MKVAIYPGSFNPFHEGHADVILKALKIFDNVIIAIGHNPEKPFDQNRLNDMHADIGWFMNASDCDKTICTVFNTLLVDYIAKLKSEGTEVSAIIRGLRNTTDFEFEKTQQYWNEDLNIKIPTTYFITDRKLSHISSSAIRAIDKIKDT